MCKKDLVHLGVMFGYMLLERWMGKTKVVKANSVLELVECLIKRRMEK